ncbi:MAG TPA: hypothetical protein DDW31_06965 [candidate division Zixibacteria bacterium]|nr:hypothetical protein [candidate division Zixibacteria bacterium]
MVLAVSAACALGGCCHGDKKEEGYKKIEISKLAAAPQKMEGRRLSVSGRLENAGGNYFTDLRPALRDGKGGEIAVNAWLPLGVPPPRPGDTGRDRPRLMSDLLGKKVRLSGVWEKTESGHALRVESDIIIEEER